MKSLIEIRTFQNGFTEEYARATRYHQPLSLLMLDVDYFKHCNNSFGYLAGRTLRRGGEEFVVISTQIDDAGAAIITERIRVTIAGAAWNKRPVTASLGICMLTLDTLTPESMIACAGKALHYPKEAGRNRVTHGNPSAPLAPAND